MNPLTPNPSPHKAGERGIFAVALRRTYSQSAIPQLLFSGLQIDRHALGCVHDVGVRERVVYGRIGKTVRIRRGPAAVSGDENRSCH